MFTLKKIQIINAPIKDVFHFFESPENLEKITPPSLGFIIKTPKPLTMKEGAIFDYTIKLGLIKFPWKTLISKYNPPYVFQDIQKSGPYKKWEHTHEFIDMGDKTKIIDTVIYDLFPKFLSETINNLFIKRRVEEIFDFRTKKINQIFNNKLEVKNVS
ncbi:MAG: SRPBCC family protein [Melioribacteraceae bacterium]